jgi:hypothetical protein
MEKAAMRHPSSRLLVALLTFAAGVSISGLWHRADDSIPRPGEAAPAATQPMPPARPLSPVAEMHACGPTGNYHVFRAADGTAISVSNESFPSAARASRELRERLRSATEIIGRRPEVDGRGRKVGERVVATIGGNVYVLETSGKSLSSTSARSMKHIIEFEKN